MARPADWQPLADHDPVPGDVRAVRDEAGRLESVARTIKDQVARLKAIGADTTAPAPAPQEPDTGELRSAARDLADRLEEAHGRYSRVSGHLSGWADDLEACQEESVAVLHDARDAQRRIESDRAAGVEESFQGAREDLRAARGRLAEIVRRRDERAMYWGARIERDDGPDPSPDLASGPSHDLTHDLAHAATPDPSHETAGDQAPDLARRDPAPDPARDPAGDLVDRDVRRLGELAGALGAIATSCALLSLVPGLRILAVMAAVLSGVDLLTRLALALAGDGDRADVSLDVRSLLVFGTGAPPSRRPDTAPADDIPAPAGTASVASESAAAAMTAAATNALWAGRASAVRQAPDRAEPAGGRPGFLRIPDAGDADGAEAVAYFKAVGERFPQASDVTARIAKVTPSLAALQAAFRLGEGADLIGRSFGPAFPVFGVDSPWSEFKESCTKQAVGTSW